MSSMKFCDECNNMLFPCEDKDEKILIYKCKRCQKVDTEETNRCVYTNELKKKEEDQFKNVNLKELISDPTLPRTKTVACKSCRKKEAVLLQESSQNSMNIWFVCTNPDCKAEPWKEK